MMTIATNDEFLFLLVDVARLMRTRIDRRGALARDDSGAVGDSDLARAPVGAVAE